MEGQWICNCWSCWLNRTSMCRGSLLCNSSREGRLPPACPVDSQRHHGSPWMLDLLDWGSDTAGLSWSGPFPAPASLPNDGAPASSVQFSLPLLCPSADTAGPGTVSPPSLSFAHLLHHEGATSQTHPCLCASGPPHTHASVHRGLEAQHCAVVPPPDSEPVASTQCLSASYFSGTGPDQYCILSGRSKPSREGNHRGAGLCTFWKRSIA